MSSDAKQPIFITHSDGTKKKYTVGSKHVGKALVETPNL
jgi:hypothetical protein